MKEGGRLREVDREVKEGGRLREVDREKRERWSGRGRWGAQ